MTWYVFPHNERFNSQARFADARHNPVQTCFAILAPSVNEIPAPVFQLLEPRSFPDMYLHKVLLYFLKPGGPNIDEFEDGADTWLAEGVGGFEL